VTKKNVLKYCHHAEKLLTLTNFVLPRSDNAPSTFSIKCDEIINFLTFHKNVGPKKVYPSVTADLMLPKVFICSWFVER
jgi:hypothetical protein